MAAVSLAAVLLGQEQETPPPPLNEAAAQTLEQEPPALPPTPVEIPKSADALRQIPPPSAPRPARPAEPAPRTDLPPPPVAAPPRPPVVTVEPVAPVEVAPLPAPVVVVEPVPREVMELMPKEQETDEELLAMERLRRGEQPPAKEGEEPLPIRVFAPAGLEYDVITNVWQGEFITITRGDLRITADKGRVDMDKQEAYADGNVHLTQEGRVIVCDSLFYEFATGKAHFVNFRSYTKPFYIAGATAEKLAEGEFRIQDGWLSTCDYDEPHWRFRAKSIEIRGNKTLVADRVTLNLGQRTIARRQRYTRDLADDRPTWSVVPGYRRKFGPFLLATRSWKLGEKIDGDLHLDYRLWRGPAAGLDFDYDAGALGKGLFESYYARDRRAENLLGDPIDEDRYRLHWRHRAEWDQDIRLTTFLTKLSDDAIEKDFFEREFRRSIQPDSFVELRKRAPNWTLTLLTRPQLNTFFTTTERLPELALDAQRQQLFGGPIFYESSTTISHLNQSFASGPADFDALRLDTFHQLLLPRTYFGWLSLTPKVGIRGTHYSKSVVDDDDISRWVFNAGAEASVKFWRQWDVENPRLGIHGLRHIFQPTLEYVFVNASREPFELLQFDTTFAASGRLPFNHLAPASFPQWDQIDAIHDQHFLRMGVRNKFQTQRYDQTWDLADLGVFFDWHLNRDHTVLPLEEPLIPNDLSNIHVDFRFYPTRWLAFRADARIDASAGILNEFDTETRFTPNDWLNFGLITRYLHESQTIFGEPSSLFGTDLALKLSEQWSLRASHRFEADSGTLQEQEYMIARDLHDWVIAVAVRDARGDLQVMLVFSLKAFPARVRLRG